MSQHVIFQNCQFFIIFLNIVYDNMFVSAQKSPWAVPFGSYTLLLLGYQCLILRVVDQYGQFQFQNGHRKIHDCSRNVLLHMIFLNFACLTRFGCLTWHFIFVQVFKKLECDIYDWIQDGCQKMIKKMFKFSHFLQIFQDHMFYSVREPPRSVSFGSETPLESKSYD